MLNVRYMITCVVLLLIARRTGYYSKNRGRGMVEHLVTKARRNNEQRKREKKHFESKKKVVFLEVLRGVERTPVFLGISGKTDNTKHAALASSHISLEGRLVRGEALPIRLRTKTFGIGTNLSPMTKAMSACQHERKETYHVP